MRVTCVLCAVTGMGRGGSGKTSLRKVHPPQEVLEAGVNSHVKSNQIVCSDSRCPTGSEWSLATPMFPIEPRTTKGGRSILLKKSFDIKR